MARLSALFALFGLLSTTIASASPQHNFEKERRELDCDNTCYFDSFPGGSCVDYPACMCSQKKLRETYFCCMAENCDSSVMPDSVQRQHFQCGLINMPFSFDAEVACGNTLTTSSASARATSAATGSSSSSAARTSVSSTATSGTTAVTSGTSSTESRTSSGSAASQTSSGESTQTPTANSAGSNRVGLRTVAIVVAACGVLS